MKVTFAVQGKRVGEDSFAGQVIATVSEPALRRQFDFEFAGYRIGIPLDRRAAWLRFSFDGREVVNQQNLSSEALSSWPLGKNILTLNVLRAIVIGVEDYFERVIQSLSDPDAKIPWTGVLTPNQEVIVMIREILAAVNHPRSKHASSSGFSSVKPTDTIHGSFSVGAEDKATEIFFLETLLLRW